MTYVELRSFGVIKEKELEAVLAEVNRFLKSLDKRTTRYVQTRLRPMSSDKLFCYVELEKVDEGQYFLTDAERAAQIYEQQQEQAESGQVDVPVDTPKPKPVPKPRPKEGV